MTVQYLIDSENVGDFWIPLLELPGQDTELIVFYTRNSPHMSYDSLIRLKESDRTVTFIKCYEGTNALDFQLVSELGYRISKDEDGSFIIVTNDTGFDAAVKYWRRRKKSVKRITGKECKNLERRLREDLSTGISRTHAENVSDHPITQAERDEDRDVQAGTDRTGTEADHEARPSGPNLRDAERAAQPDPEESYTAEPDYMMDEDFDESDSEYEDSYAYNPDAEESESDMNDDEEDNLPDDSAYDIVPEETGYDTDESFVSDDEIDAETGGEMSLETDSEDAEGSFGSDAEILPDYVQSAENSSDHAVSADITDDLPFDGDDTAQESETIGENERGTSSDGVTDAVPQAIDEKEMAETTADPDYQDSDQADSGNGSEAAEKETDEVTDTDLSKTTDADQNAAVMEEQSVQSDEEPAAETSHRSKSRRSRSRRSKASSRKQEQGSAQDSDESAETADSVQTREAAGSGKAETAAETDSRKSNAGRDDTETVRDKSSDPLPAPGDDEIARIVACIGAENLAELHNQLATFYGDQGKDIYLSIKNNTRSIPVLKPDLKQKFEYYCEIIFYRSDYSGEYPSDISEYLLNVREKLNNLNSLRYALQKHYGKEKGRRFYFLLKPFAKTMYQM